MVLSDGASEGDQGLFVGVGLGGNIVGPVVGASEGDDNGFFIGFGPAVGANEGDDVFGKGNEREDDGRFVGFNMGGERAEPVVESNEGDDTCFFVGGDELGSVAPVGFGISALDERLKLSRGDIDSLCFDPLSVVLFFCLLPSSEFGISGEDELARGKALGCRELNERARVKKLSNTMKKGTCMFCLTVSDRKESPRPKEERVCSFWC